MSAPGADSDVRTDDDDVRPSQLAQAEALTTMIQASIVPIIGPLVAELAASRQMSERKDETIREQAETIGTLRSERDAARAEVAASEARHVALTPSGDPDPPELTTGMSRCRSWPVCERFCRGCSPCWRPPRWSRCWCGCADGSAAACRADEEPSITVTATTLPAVTTDRRAPPRRLALLWRHAV